MSMKKTLTTAAVALSVAAGSLIPVSAANAGEWGGNSRNNYSNDYPDFDGHRNLRRHGGEQRWYNDWRQRRDNRAYGYGRGHNRPHGPVVVYKKEKDRTGRNMAIAIGAVMLGAIIASEASRSNHR